MVDGVEEHLGFYFTVERRRKLNLELAYFAVFVISFDSYPFGSHERNLLSMEPLTIFIVVRKDLIKSLNWSYGAVTTQACHAVSAVVWKHRISKRVQEYMSSLESMHKVTLEIKNENQLRALSQALTEAAIEHETWVEQPENIATCIATLPYTKSEMGSLLKKCQLLR